VAPIQQASDNRKKVAWDRYSSFDFGFWILDWRGCAGVAILIRFRNTM